ncbi:MAG: hypothetical protein ACOYN2_04685 [Patescibacteria group bacterium]
MSTHVDRHILHTACFELFNELEVNELELNPLLLEACQQLEKRELSGMEFDRLTTGFIQVIHSIRMSKINPREKEITSLLIKLTHCINLFKSYTISPCETLKSRISHMQDMYQNLRRYIRTAQQQMLQQTTAVHA